MWKKQFFDEIATRISPTPTGGRKSHHFNCGITPDKDAFIQVRVFTNRIEVGLAIDNPSASENASAASRYRQRLSADGAGEGIEWTSEKNHYLMKALTAVPGDPVASSADEAAAIVEWWRNWLENNELVDL